MRRLFSLFAAFFFGTSSATAQLAPAPPARLSESERARIASAILTNEVVPILPVMPTVVSEHAAVWQGNVARLEATLPSLELVYRRANPASQTEHEEFVVVVRLEDREVMVRHSEVENLRFQKGYRFPDRDDMLTKTYVEGREGSSIVVVAPRAVAGHPARGLLVCSQEGTAIGLARSELHPGEWALAHVRFEGSGAVEGAQLTGLGAGLTHGQIVHAPSLPETKGLSDQATGKDPRVMLRYLPLKIGPPVNFDAREGAVTFVTAALLLRNSIGYWRESIRTSLIDVAPVMVHNPIPIRVGDSVAPLNSQGCVLIYRTTYESVRFGKEDTLPDQLTPPPPTPPTAIPDAIFDGIGH